MRRNLKTRRFATSNDKLSWDSFDDVRFWSSTPGQKLYDVAKEAYKQSLRTSDLEELATIAREANSTLRAILEAELAKPPGASDEEAVSRMGCKIILEQYLTSLGQFERQLRAVVNRFVNAIAVMSKDENLVPPEEIDWVLALHKKLVDATEERKGRITDAKSGEAEREQALLDLVRTYIKLINAAVEEGVKLGKLSALALKDTFTLEARDAASLLPFQSDVMQPRPLPLLSR